LTWIQPRKNEKNNNPTYLTTQAADNLNMTMTSIYTLTMDTNEHYAFLDKEEAYKAMRICMNQDVHFYYMERYLREGGRHHLVISGEKYQKTRDEFFSKMASQPELSLEERMVTTVHNDDTDLDRNPKKEKKVIVAEKTDIEEGGSVRPQRVDEEKPNKDKKKKVEEAVQPMVEEEAVQPRVEEEKPKKDKKKKAEEAVVEEEAVQPRVEEEKPKKDKKKKAEEAVVEEEKPKKKKVEDTALCIYVFTRGERRGQECGKTCVSGTDVCKLHNK